MSKFGSSHLGHLGDFSSTCHQNFNGAYIKYFCPFQKRSKGKSCSSTSLPSRYPHLRSQVPGLHPGQVCCVTRILNRRGLHAISSRYSAIHSLCPPDMGTRYIRELNEVEEEGRAPPSNLDTVNHLLRECCDHKAVGLFTLARFMFPGALLSQWSKGYYTCRLFVCFWLSGSGENVCLLTPSTHHHHDHHLVTLPTFVLVVLQMFPLLIGVPIHLTVSWVPRPPVTGCAGAGTGFARVIKEREFAR